MKKLMMMALAALGVMLGAQAEQTPHVHCICGASDSAAHCAASHDQTELTWTEWTSNTSLPNSAGNWYLANDVTLSSTYTPPTGVNLCLNGHVVKNGGSCNKLVSVSGTVFSLTDCCDTPHYFNKVNAGYYPTVWVYSLTTSPSASSICVKGGCITGGYGWSGSPTHSPCMNVENGGTFNFYRGNLVGNSSEQQGGGMKVCSGTTLNMYGGNVEGNFALFGYCRLEGTANIYGGSFKNNGSAKDGLLCGSTTTIYDIEVSGNVSFNGVPGLNAAGNFTMLGGKVVGNRTTTADGAFNIDTDNAVIGGSVCVTGNYCKASQSGYVYSGGAANNLYLPAGKTIAISNDVPLTSEAKIGVFTAAKPTSGSQVAVTSNRGEDCACFTSDEGYSVVNEDGAVKLSLYASFTTADVTGAKVTEVSTNGFPVAGPPYAVKLGAAVKVVYTVEDGYMFPGGYRTLTTNFTASAATTTVTLTTEQKPVDAVANPNCITFSAEEDFGIKMWKCGNPSINPSLECSTDQIYWETFNKEDGAAAGADHKLYLRGTGNTTFASKVTKSYCFTNTADSVATAIACSGNIETLLDYKTVAAGEHPEMAEYAFSYLFLNFAALTTAPELPAMTMMENCYFGMFARCTSLTAAPELPATTLAKFCYSGMFASCTSLTVAPELLATNLASACYTEMFSGCTSLTAAPELPATNLVNNCYMRMFYGCASLVVNTNAPGKAWSIPAEAKASAASADCWNDFMFAGTSGNITSTVVTPGVTYYVASALEPVTVAVPEVAGATAQLWAFDANGGWASVATNEVPSNATVRVVYTAADGKAWDNGVYVWSRELVATSAWQKASAPDAPSDWSGNESSVTLAIDTRTKKSYLDAADILPIWYAQGAEVKVKGEGEETLVKSAANTNTLAWAPAAVGVYDFAHTGGLTAQIVYATPVTLTTNGLDVTNTTVAVTADGAPIPEDGRIASNSMVTVTWTVATAGKYFADGSTTYTASFTATGAESFNAATILAAENKIPKVPAEPKVLLGVVGQRYPWNGVLSVQYWAKNTPNEGYNIAITVTLPEGTKGAKTLEASELHECKSGKNETEFNARENFGEVQIPKGVKVKATLVPMTGPRHG